VEASFAAQAHVEEPVCPVCDTVRIAEQRKGQSELLAELSRAAWSAHADRHDRKTGLLKTLVIFTHLDQMLAAVRSAEVADKNQRDRPLVPERREPHLVALLVPQARIRRSIPR